MTGPRLKIRVTFYVYIAFHYKITKCLHKIELISRDSYEEDENVKSLQTDKFVWFSTLYNVHFIDLICGTQEDQKKIQIFQGKNVKFTTISIRTKLVARLHFCCWLPLFWL